MLSHAAAIPVNRLLRGASWALRRLEPYAGRTARFDVFPFSFAFTVTAEGEVGAATSGAVPDVTIRLSPPLALRILAGDEAAVQDVAISGDAEFAQTIRFVALNLDWDAEEHLARILGDVAAHRVASAGRDFVRWQARTLDSASRSLVEYWTDEAPLIARRADIERFVRDVDALRDDVARAAARVDRLLASRR